MANMATLNEREARLAGVLLGTALGDALGLPFEGMSRRRVRRVLAGQPLEHRFLFGRGMVSDDTEHTCLVAQALAATQGKPRAFARSLAWRLRCWLLGMPAGVGWATLRGIVRLWLGFPPEKSGVWSAGNGPAMRAAILGVYAAHDEDRLAALVWASTRMTHSDPRAFDGALAIATAAALVASEPRASVDTRRTLERVSQRLEPGEVRDLIERASRRVAVPAERFAEAIGAGAGVSGFVNHTVPLALLCWARHPSDARAAVTEVVLLGGDTDTNAAIVGALVGAGMGAAALPSSWLAGLAEWPHSATWMRQLARRLAQGAGPAPERWPWLWLRNAVFMLGVARMLLRRALPPY